MRRASLAAAVLALAGLGVVAPATPALAATTTVPVSIDSSAENTSSVAVPIPLGVNPTAITGVLNMDDVPSGTIEFLVNGKPVVSVPTTLYAKVSIPVTSTDVTTQRTIGLALRYVPADAVNATDCLAPTSTSAVLRKIGLEYDGTETAPATLSTFFPAAAASVDVTVPENASDDLLAAGIVAVGALSSRYPEGTPVRLGVAGQPLASTGAGARLVVIEGGGSTVTTSIADPVVPGVPTLSLRGSGDALISAARALGGTALDLANTASTDNLSETPQKRDVGLTRTLTELDASGLKLSGWGESTAHVEVPQDSFGGPVSKLAVDLVGTHTALPAGATAQVDVFLNGTLVDSAALDADTALDLSFDVPAGLLLSDNDLDVKLTALPEGGCLPTTPQLPLEVAIDPDRSTIVGTRGAGNLAGFQAQPQSFEGTLAVGLRPTGKQRTAAAVDAAMLVSALQRSAAAPIEIDFVEADELLAGDDPALLVGASYTDSVALDAPVRLTGVRLLDNVDAQSQVSSNEPFGAFEAVRQNDRDVLALGSWSPGASGVAPALSSKIATQIFQNGWRDLTGDVLLADDSDNPLVAIRSNPAEVTSLRASDNEDDSNTLARYFVIGIAVLLVLLLLQLLATVRRDRRAKERAAEQARAAEPVEPLEPADVTPDEDADAGTEGHH